MVYVFIILLIVTLLLGCCILFINIENDLSLIDIKLKKSSENIEKLLSKKQESMNKAYKIIKKNIKKKDYLKDFSELKKDKLSLSEFDNELNKYLEIMISIKDDYKSLNTKEYKNVLKEINEIDEEIIANEKYSNKNSIILIKKLKGIYKIVAKFKKFKNYDVYEIKEPINE